MILNPRTTIAGVCFMKKKEIKISLTKEEIFSIYFVIKKEINKKRRQKFGVLGLGTKIWGIMKKNIKPKEYDDMKVKWRNTYPSNLKIEFISEKEAIEGD